MLSVQCFQKEQNKMLYTSPTIKKALLKFTLLLKSGNKKEAQNLLCSNFMNRPRKKYSTINIHKFLGY